MKNNSNLWQESEMENSDADLTVDEGKINEEYDNMNIFNVIRALDCGISG